MIYEISTSIEIEAKKEEIWESLTDFKSFPAWNPFLRKIWIKNLLPGEPFWLLVHAPSSFPVLMRGKMLRIDPLSLILWQCDLIHPFLLRGMHKLELLEATPTATRFFHTERFEGILPFFLWMAIKPRVQEGFELMNQALKNKLENWG